MGPARAGLHFVVVCVCLSHCFADRCSPGQCKSLVPFLEDCTDKAHFGGGDHVIVLCEGRHGKIAVRLALVEDIPNANDDGMSLVRSNDLAGSLARGRDSIQSLIVPKFRKALRQTGWRRIMKASEFRGGTRWREEFSWKKMIFPPATLLSECLVCLRLSSTVPVLNPTGNHVVNLSRSVQIGLGLIKGVDGSFKTHGGKLSLQAAFTILVGYHLDLATMADSAHQHDAHAGNVLLSFAGANLPEIRWHDFGGSYSSYSPSSMLLARTSDFAEKIEGFSATAINHTRLKDPDFAKKLDETRKECVVIGADIDLIRVCLRQRAFSFVETMLSADAMDSSARRKLLERISRGLDDYSQRELWRQFIAGKVV